MNKTSGDDKIQAELFQILEDDVVKLFHSCQQIWELHQWPQDWKCSVFISNPKKGNAIEFSNYHICTHLTPLQRNAQNIHAGFQGYMN